MAVTNPTPIYNFGSGPGMMPPQVLLKAKEEMLDWQGSGQSVWEMPFTGSRFQEIADQARDDLRQLLQVPDHFRILFMQGGASAQFSLLPMNLMAAGGTANYIDTGHWSGKAIREASRYCPVQVVASSEQDGYLRIPDLEGLELSKDAAYCHITSNETASGVQYSHLPDTGSVPLIADMTSDFLARPIDFNRFGLVYAGAQKNIGPAGLTIVIIRKDLIRSPMPTTPSAFSYQVIDDNNGRFNTPLTYGIYLMGLVLQQLIADGGVAAAEKRNREKSQRLYRYLDQHPFYLCPVESAHRSSMNHCFGLTEADLTERFIDQATDRGLLYLNGHPATGGIRASIYNAMPVEGVDALIGYMEDFADQFGQMNVVRRLNDYVYG